MKNDCFNLYFLSTVACQLAQCLTNEEVSILAANLKALGELLEVTLSYQETDREPALSQSQTHSQNFHIFGEN